MIFVQNSMDAIDSDDGSEENFQTNLEQLFTEAKADLWIACGNCLNKGKEVLDYYDIIQPKDTLLLHWDTQMPILTSGVIDQFNATESGFSELTPEDLWIPNQYLSRFKLNKEGFFSVASPLQRSMFAAP